MRLRPRHYVLIAVIIGIGIFNIYRARKARAPQSVAVQTSANAPSSPAWTAFDKAAALRDAPDAQFSPALQNLQQTVDAATTANDPTVSNVKGCQTWLMFYRQGVVHPSADKSWKQRSSQHLDACVKNHQDAG
jgi:hypothetical protein